MSIGEDPQQLARLRQKASDFAISPTTENTLTIWHELNAISSGKVELRALLQLDTQHLLLSVRRPQPQLILTAAGEDSAEIRMELEVRDHIKRAAHKVHSLLHRIAISHGFHVTTGC